jgi:hypothetical protein
MRKIEFRNALLLGAVAAALLGGCKKDKESLIVVSVATADNNVSGLMTLVVGCGGTSQVFDLATALSKTPIVVGLYVPSSVVGQQTVTATAVAPSGGACNGYSGSAMVAISEAGSEVAASVIMMPAKTCAADAGTDASGAAGQGGSGPGTGGSGAGGSGGSGPGSAGSGAAGRGGSGGSGSGGAPSCTASAPPPVGTPPSFACCVEYDQVTPENCDPSTGTEIDSVAFSPDGRTFASAAYGGGDIKIWTFDGHVLTPAVTILDSYGWSSMTFSPDGTMLAIAVTGGIDLWSTSNWSFITELSGSSNFFNGVGFTPDGTHVIGLDEDGYTGSLYVWDLGGTPRELPILTKSLTDDPTRLAVSPKLVGGGLGIAVGYYDGFADVLAYTGGAFTTPTNLLVDTTYPDPVWGAAFSPDGTLLAFGDDDAVIHFWSYPLTTTAESGPELAFGLTGNDDAVYSVAFSPNGGYIVGGGGYFDGDSNASYWSATARAGYIRLNTSHDVTAVAFSPGGNAIAGGEINCGKVFMCTN